MNTTRYMAPSLVRLFPHLVNQSLSPTLPQNLGSVQTGKNHLFCNACTVLDISVQKKGVQWQALMHKTVW
jgi:hypothetical protein